MYKVTYRQLIDFLTIITDFLTKHKITEKKQYQTHLQVRPITIYSK